MPCYFFDLYDGGVKCDDEGSELPDFKAAQTEATNTLLKIAAHGILRKGDRQHFAVVVRVDAERVIYTATLAFTQLRLSGTSSEA